MESSHDQFDSWQEMMRFQVDIADRWLHKGTSSDDSFAKFFFLFAGFNAIYFLWGNIDDVKNEERRRAHEGRLIQNLLNKFDVNSATAMLNTVASQVTYFTTRPPISRMDKRTATRPRHGDEQEGRNARRRLSDSSNPQGQLEGLGTILYLVRSNLVHGSKFEAGDDLDIINAAVMPLETLLIEVLQYTKQFVRY